MGLGRNGLRGLTHSPPLPDCPCRYGWLSQTPQVPGDLQKGGDPHHRSAAQPDGHRDRSPSQ